jgi:heat shock protein HtpX
MHNHYNGLKTTLLFSGIFAILLALGSVIAGGTYLWAFALFGVAMTGYGYWNSDKIAIKAMRARPVTEAEAPAMYRIVRELSAGANKPTPSPPDATRPTPRSAAPRASWRCSTSVSCAGSWATS